MADQVSLGEIMEDSLTVKLGGDNSIDAELLANTIKSVVDLIECSRNEVSPNSNLNLKVEAFSVGSFEIWFKAIFEIITSDKVANAATVVTSIGGGVIGALKIAKLLSGKKPSEVKKEEKSVKITNYNGETISVDNSTYNIYTEPRVNDNIAGLFNALEEDNTRTSFEVSTKDNNVVIENKYFDGLSKPTSLEPLSEDLLINTINEIDIIIRKPDLTGRSKWGFYLQKAFTATIEDENFISLVNKSEIHFGNKDMLKVDLRIETRLNADGEIVAGQERYFVEKVYKHIPFKDQFNDRQISL